ncbi:ribokinase [Frigoribacterium sp. NBH87]|uniref:ribokinase n=1 Tax=unclassified Frigoribacterium TaxID=2627005 RepID=UPI00162A70AD|nr:MULTISPECIES: ribokinase [unclassified Frigoribacterium]MBD8729175.1 ribokinase [Frigoribacterium sp. CFBP 13707]QNE44211.1 ribokinase [Frigoribacterium sp. NBH87]
MSTTEPTVAVVGSVNLDLVARVREFPRAGETVLGSEYEEAPGGKGLNQAVGAVRRGTTALVSSVGDDPVGDRVVAWAAGHGIDVAGVHRAPGLTGRALITVAPDGENIIVVAPLANGALTPEHVAAELDRIRPDVVLAQHEISEAALRAAVEWCRASGARFVFNASPVRSVPVDVLDASDPVVVNAAEGLALLRAAEAARPVGEPGSRSAVREGGAWRPADVARRLLELSPSAVVTAGGAGAFVADAAGVEHVTTSTRVVALDTTGAGDEFAGVLVAELAGGASLHDAAGAANDAAGALVQVPRERR